MSRVIGKDANQALEIAKFALNFLKKPEVSPGVILKTKMWHTDITAYGIVTARWGLSGLWKSLKAEALLYKSAAGAFIYDCPSMISPEKAAMANCVAFAELYKVGFPYELCIPTYFPVAMAAAQQRGLTGYQALLGMILVEELRARLQKAIKIDPDLDEMIHGGIASAATYGALMGASAKQIDQAIGSLLYKVPMVGLGKKVEDFQVAESSIASVIRVMNNTPGIENALSTGFWRGKLADIELPTGPDDFVINDFRFRFGVYNFLFETPIESVFSLVRKERSLIKDLNSITNIEFTLSKHLYEIVSSAYGLDVDTYDKAYNSLRYTISILLKKCSDQQGITVAFISVENIFKCSMLTHEDFIYKGVKPIDVLELMKRITFTCDESYEKLGAKVKVVLGSRNLESQVVSSPMSDKKRFGQHVQNLMYHKAMSLATLFAPNYKIYLSKFDKMETDRTVDVTSLYNLDKMFEKLKSK